MLSHQLSTPWEHLPCSHFGRKFHNTLLARAFFYSHFTSYTFLYFNLVRRHSVVSTMPENSHVVKAAPSSPPSRLTTTPLWSPSESPKSSTSSNNRIESNRIESNRIPSASKLGGSPIVIDDDDDDRNRRALANFGANRPNPPTQSHDTVKHLISMGLKRKW